MNLILSFISGGLICVIGQILIDKTHMTPARILICYVITGVVLSGFGIYEKLTDMFGAGVTVPLTGFGHSLAKGVKEAINEQGFLGIFTGGLKATAGGITVAVLSGLIVALLFRPKDKN